MATLTAIECKALEEAHIFLPSLATSPVKSNKRKISASFFVSPPSSASGSTRSGSSSASVTYHSYSKAHIDGIDCALDPESAEALEFVGLESRMAESIFDRYSQRPAPEANPSDLIDYARGEMSRIPKLAHLPDQEVLEAVGVAPWLRAAILDPQYTHIYETESLQYWVNTSIRTNYNSLYRIIDELKAQAQVHGASKKKQKRGEVDEHTFTRPVPNVEEDITGKIATMNIVGDNDKLCQAHVKVQAAPALNQDCEVFYKGKSVDEMPPDLPLVNSDGNIDFRALETLPGGDFNHNSSAWYWTKDRETAEDYRCYAANRERYCESWIVRIEIPKSVIQGLRIEKLFYGTEFKEYTWTCKKKWPMPDKFDKFTKEADVIVGHICKGKDTKWRHIRNLQDALERITSSDMMRIGERSINPSEEKAQQWVVMKEAVMQRLATQVRGKMHIDITDATCSISKGNQ